MSRKPQTCRAVVPKRAAESAENPDLRRMHRVRLLNILSWPVPLFDGYWDILDLLASTVPP
jgi:hypothetical protein